MRIQFEIDGTTLTRKKCYILTDVNKELSNKSSIGAAILWNINEYDKF